MKIVRTSALTGKQHEMDLPVTDEQYNAWRRGVLIQRVMPHLTADEREFIISGVTRDEWEQTFGKEEDLHGQS